jgi:molybdenum cofactor synthesis domain-containing protein
MRRALVLTVSDGVQAGTRMDASGQAVAERLTTLGFAVMRGLVADDAEQISTFLRATAGDVALIVSTGGTGLTPRDVTPQATLAVVDYEVPGLAEAMRAAGRAVTPMADLSRGVVGVIGRSLVVNVPGSPKAAVESLAAIEPALGHALETLAGPYDHDVAPVSSLAEHADRARSTTPPPSASADAAADEATAIVDGEPIPIPPGDPSDPWRDLPASSANERGE